jgi:Flp pilus assembly pilin Flp
MVAAVEGTVVAAAGSTVVVEVIREVVDLIRGRFIPVPAFIRGRFIPVPAFIRDHFNSAYRRRGSFPADQKRGRRRPEPTWARQVGEWRAKWPDSRRDEKSPASAR